MSIFPSFFKKYFVRKNWRGEGELLLKNGTVDGYVTLTKHVIRLLNMLRLRNMLFMGRIYIVRGPWHLGDFCSIFLPNKSKDQKKFYYLSSGP